MLASKKLNQRVVVPVGFDSTTEPNVSSAHEGYVLTLFVPSSRLSCERNDASGSFGSSLLLDIPWEFKVSGCELEVDISCSYRGGIFLSDPPSEARKHHVYRALTQPKMAPVIRSPTH